MRWLVLFFVLLTASVVAAQPDRPSPFPGDGASSLGVLIDGTSGFLQPRTTVAIRALEVGQVVGCPLEEGDRVQVGDVLYQLDDSALQAELAIARHRAARTSERDAAAAELAVKKRRYDTLTRLQSDGHSGGEELARARADYELALAARDAATEQTTSASLEVARLQTQLDRRTVRAPVDGTVIDLSLGVGETMAASETAIATIVDTSQLQATFYLPAESAVQLASGAEVSLLIQPPGRAVVPVAATVRYVSPVTDAESGTVRIRVDLDNADDRYRSGTRCRLSLPSRDRLRF